MPLTAASQARWAAQALARIEELGLSISQASKLSGQSPRWLRPRLDCRQPVDETEAAQTLDALGLVRYPSDLTAHHHPDHHPSSLITIMPITDPITDPELRKTDRSPFANPPEGHELDESASMFATHLNPTITQVAAQLLRAHGRVISEVQTRVTRSSDGESLNLSIHCNVRRAPR